MNPRNPSLNPSSALEQFQAVNEMALAQIGTLNTAYDDYQTHGGGLDEEFKDLVEEGLASDLQIALDGMRSLVEAAPYDQFAQESAKVDLVLSQLKAAREASNPQLEAALEKIDAMMTTAVRMTPGSEAKIRELAARRKTAVTAEMLDPEIENQIGDLQTLQAEIDGVCEAAGAAWPIPKLALYMQAPTDAEIATSPKTTLTTSPVPLDAEPKPSPQAGAKPRERAIDPADVPADIIACLVQNDAKSLAALDFIEALYPGEADATDSHQMMSFVRAVLSPGNQGRHIQAALQQQGFVLCYGWAETTGSDGVVTKSRTYQAVAVGEPIATMRARLRKGATTIQSVPANLLTTEEVLELDTEAGVGADLDYTLTGIARVAAASTRGSVTPSTGAVMGSEAGADPSAPNRRSTRDAWKATFRKSVGEAINYLAEDGLIGRGELTAHTVSLKTRSGKLGTEESIDRAVRAGVIGRLPPQTRLGNVPLDAATIVAVYLLNSNAAILGRNSRAKQSAALAIIKDAVGKYLDKQKEAAQ